MDFNEDIQKFENLGLYEYGFDSYGNIIIDPKSEEFNQNYLSLPINNFSYNKKKIESFYDVSFDEFIPTPSIEIQNQIEQSNESDRNVDNLVEQNKSLNKQLTELISKSEQDGVKAEKESVRQVIVSLRIMLGEGETEDQFEEEFPYGRKDE